MKKYSLTQNECDVLLFLRNNPKLNTAKDITNWRGIAKSNVSTAVESLKKKGYISSHTDPENRRTIRLALTDSSVAMVNELYSCQHKCVDRIKSGLTNEDVSMLRKLLDKVDANVLAALSDLER